MGLLTTETPLSTALEQHPSLIPLVSRFGIRLGVGDKSVAAVCADHAIDERFMLVLMNTYLFENYFPEERLKSFHVSQIVDYLQCLLPTFAVAQHRTAPAFADRQRRGRESTFGPDRPVFRSVQGKPPGLDRV